MQTKRYLAMLMLLGVMGTAFANAFDSTIVKAQNEAIANQPKLALKDYQHALLLAENNPTQRRIALFGIGKMLLWLSDYPQASLVYAELLHSSLNAEDYETALTGYVNALAAMDRPIKAYRSIPAGFHYTQPEMVVAAAQAADWAGWPDKAYALLQTHEELLAKIPPYSHLGRQLALLRSHLSFCLRKNHIIPGYQFQADTDNFSFQKELVSYVHMITPTAVAQLTVGNSSYTQNSQNENGTVLGLTQSLRATDDLNLNLSTGSILFDDWQPFLWNVGGGYRPNDYLQVGLFNRQEIVETIAAIQDQITQNSTELGLKIAPIYRLNILASAYTHNFSDDNQRNGLFANASFLLSNQLGLSVQVQTQEYWNSNPDSPDYFSPSSFSANTALLVLRHRLFGRGLFYIRGGLGRQKIAGDASSPTQQYALGVEFPFNDKLLLSGSYGYSSVANSLTGFSYHYGSVSLDYSF